ncbi:ABC transporter permease subunit [Halalkalibacillus halophilus]|uniref:ABC transporter permease subunit n=1 Tax=Halalkalibacillus halophilus TaxID=392827 RepID=UPI0004224335|nr:ABC transporter permease subunit [Halalkalibacillus halophilus]
MFRRFISFELKLIVKNKKHLMIMFLMILIFPLFYIQQLNETEQTLAEQKEMEAASLNAQLDRMANLEETLTEQEEAVQDSLLNQLSHVNMQAYYLNNDRELYIEEGLALVEEQRHVQELNHAGMSERFIMKEDQIKSEEERLLYIQEHSLPLTQDSSTASNFLVNALKTLSGLLFTIIILFSGSEIISYENRHKTVMNGIPVSTFTKILSKLTTHSIYLTLSLIVGVFIGGIVSTWYSGIGHLNYPVIIYRNGTYTAISTIEYILFVIGLLFLVTIFILLLSVLLNMIFDHAFINLVVGTGVFLLPALLSNIFGEVSFLQPLLFVDVTSVLSGEFANQLSNPSVDYYYAILWLIGLCIITFLCIYMNKLLKTSKGFKMNKRQNSVHM